MLCLLDAFDNVLIQPLMRQFADLRPPRIFQPVLDVGLADMIENELRIRAPPRQLDRIRHREMLAPVSKFNPARDGTGIAENILNRRLNRSDWIENS